MLGLPCDHTVAFQNYYFLLGFKKIDEGDRDSIVC